MLNLSYPAKKLCHDKDCKRNLDPNTLPHLDNLYPIAISIRNYSIPTDISIVKNHPTPETDLIKIGNLQRDFFPF